MEYGNTDAAVEVEKTGFEVGEVFDPPEAGMLALEEDRKQGTEFAAEEQVVVLGVFGIGALQPGLKLCGSGFGGEGVEPGGFGFATASKQGGQITEGGAGDSGEQGFHLAALRWTELAEGTGVGSGRQFDFLDVAAEARMARIGRIEPGGEEYAVKSFGVGQLGGGCIHGFFFMGLPRGFDSFFGGVR